MSSFVHRLQLDQIRDGDRLDLVSDEAECAAIAERLGLSINALRNRAQRLRAALESCVREKLGRCDESPVMDTSDERT